MPGTRTTPGQIHTQLDEKGRPQTVTYQSNYPVPVQETSSSSNNSISRNTSPTGGFETANETEASNTNTASMQAGSTDSSNTGNNSAVPTPDDSPNNTAGAQEIQRIFSNASSKPTTSFDQSTPVMDQSLKEAKDKLDNLFSHIRCGNRPTPYTKFLSSLTTLKSAPKRKELADTYHRIREELDFDFIRACWWPEEQLKEVQDKMDELDKMWLQAGMDVTAGKVDGPGFEVYQDEASTQNDLQPTAPQPPAAATADKDLVDPVDKESVEAGLITEPPELNNDQVPPIPAAAAASETENNGTPAAQAAPDNDPNNETPEIIEDQLEKQTETEAHRSEELQRQVHGDKQQGTPAHFVVPPPDNPEDEQRYLALNQQIDAELAKAIHDLEVEKQQQAQERHALRTANTPMSYTPDRGFGSDIAHLSEDTDEFVNYPWKERWAVHKNDMTMVPLRELKENTYVFEGDLTKYQFFRSHFRINVHMNKCLSVAQRSLMLRQFVSKTVAREIAAEPTNNIKAYAAAVYAMDDLYDRNTREAFTTEIRKLQAYNNTSSTLAKLRNVVSTASVEFPNEDGSSSLTYAAISKLGTLAPLFAQHHMDGTANTLAALAAFLDTQHAFSIRMEEEHFQPKPKYQHYRSKPQYKTRNQFAAQAELEEDSESDEHHSDEEQEYQEWSDEESDQAYALYGKKKPIKKNRWDMSKEVCPLDGKKHLLSKCDKFRYGMLQPKRLAYVKKKKRCERCISPNHKTKDCPKKNTVTCQQCKSDNHHFLLHPMEVDTSGSESDNEDTTKRAQGNTSLANCTKNEITLQQVAITLRHPVTNESEDLYVILDSGSNITMFDAEIADNFRLSGETLPLTTQGVGGQEYDSELLTMPMILESIDGKVKEIIPANFTRKPTAKIIQANWSELKTKFPQFKDLPLPTPRPGTNPKIRGIIGNDLTNLTKLDLDQPGPAQIGANRPLEPLAQRTMIGWTISGYSDPDTPTMEAWTEGRTVLNHMILMNHATIKRPDYDGSQKPVKFIIKELQRQFDDIDTYLERSETFVKAEDYQKEKDEKQFFGDVEDILKMLQADSEQNGTPREIRNKAELENIQPESDPEPNNGKQMKNVQSQEVREQPKQLKGWKKFLRNATANITCTKNKTDRNIVESKKTQEGAVKKMLGTLRNNLHGKFGSKIQQTRQETNRQDQQRTISSE